MITGTCLCNAVRFELDERKILLFNLCHCSRCQKHSGTAHTSQLQVMTQHFRWLSGENLIASFHSSSTVHRQFCKVCGSRVPSSQDWDHGLVAIPAGLLDDDPGVRPEIQIHTDSMAPWHQLDESIASIAGQGEDEFWAKFMQQKRNV